MEKEPKIPESLEDVLRKKGYKIESYEETENWAQCDKKDCFQEAKWIIEGTFYCPQHKEGALKLLEEISNEVEKRIVEQSKLEEERLKQASRKGKE